MKTFKITIIILILGMSTICQAQSYATLRYWGKDIKLDRNFFQVLNNNYSNFMNTVAPDWKYYDAKDYQESYAKIVESLTSPQFVIIVSEANQLSWQNPVGTLPGTDGDKKRSKKSYARATWLLYHVLLPALNTTYNNQL